MNFPANRKQNASRGIPHSFRIRWRSRSGSRGFGSKSFIVHAIWRRRESLLVNSLLEIELPIGFPDVQEPVDTMQ